MNSAGISRDSAHYLRNAVVLRGLNNPKPVAKVRQEMRSLFDTATPQAQKRLAGLILERIVVEGKKITLYAKAAGIIAAFDVENL